MAWYGQPDKQRPFVLFERGECTYCCGEGKDITGYEKVPGKRAKQPVYKECFHCKGVGKLDQEVPLLEALRVLGVLIKDEL